MPHIANSFSLSLFPDKLVNLRFISAFCESQIRLLSVQVNWVVNEVVSFSGVLLVTLLLPACIFLRSSVQLSFRNLASEAVCLRHEPNRVTVLRVPVLLCAVLVVEWLTLCSRLGSLKGWLRCCRALFALCDNDLLVGLCLGGDHFIGHHSLLILSWSWLCDLASLIATNAVFWFLLSLRRLGCLCESRHLAAKRAEALG